MIDPKLDDLPAKKTADSSSATNERTSAAKPRTGLSINDTVAADANLSIGGQGTDTSGVRSGAGAGAGSSHLSPATTGSPAPNVAPGQSGSGGTTPLSDSAIGVARTAELSELTHDEIAQHAYRCWKERGCPEGSPEEDWHRAERELRERRAVKAAAASA